MIDIYDIEGLKQEERNIPQVDVVAANHRYAHIFHLKKFAGISSDVFINCTVEHGFYYSHKGGYWDEIMHNNTVVLTQSNYRKNIIESMYEKIAVPIGPYIAYVDGVYPLKTIDEIKSENGKTLLVLPSKSIESERSDFDRNIWIDVIGHHSRNFDHVMICLSKYDLQHGEAKRYISLGYEVVSAGETFSTYFLPRMRSILEIADCVLANEFTTGLVYAVWLNKPVFLFSQELKKIKIEKVMYLPRQNPAPLDEFKRVTSDENYNRIEEQKEWGIHYCGFDCVKEKAELAELLNGLRK